MKRKDLSLSRKLNLGKATVSTLTTDSQSAIKGGATVPDNGCAGSNHCPTIVNCFATQKCNTYPFNQDCMGSNYCTIKF